MARSDRVGLFRLANLFRSMAAPGTTPPVRRARRRENQSGQHASGERLSFSLIKTTNEFPNRLARVELTTILTMKTAFSPRRMMKSA